MSDIIPQEVQVIILNQLPVKSLLRFRCVCKWWKQLIDSPTFMQEHLAVQNPRILVECDEPNLLVIDPRTLPSVGVVRGPIEDEARRITLFGTLHGVVCIYDKGSNLLIWNPSVRKCSTIPLPLNFDRLFQYAYLTCYAFWIDPSNGEFKIIVLLFDFYDGKPVDVRGILYSSRRHAWSVVSPGEVGRIWIPLQNSALMIGGLAHWVGRYEFSNELGLEKNAKVIMSFDFRQERFDFIEIPNKTSTPRLCHWQGSLSVVYWSLRCYLGCDSCEIDIYSRQEGSWVKMYGFEVFGHIEDVFWPLEEIEGKGKALVQQRHNTFDAKLALYDPGVGCIPVARGFNYLDVAFDFVESLLFPLE